MQNTFVFAFTVSLLLVAPGSAIAQSAGVSQPPRPTTTCGPTALILITVVNDAGAVVSDAGIEVRRTRDGRLVRRGEVELPGSGEYLVMDDVALSLVGPKASRFSVLVRRGKQKASVVLRVGRSADGCHVRVISGPTRLTLK